MHTSTFFKTVLCSVASTLLLHTATCHAASHDTDEESLSPSWSVVPVRDIQREIATAVPIDLGAPAVAETMPGLSADLGSLKEYAQGGAKQAGQMVSSLFSCGVEAIARFSKQQAENKKYNQELTQLKQQYEARDKARVEAYKALRSKVKDRRPWLEELFKASRENVAPERYPHQQAYALQQQALSQAKEEQNIIASAVSETITVSQHDANTIKRAIQLAQDRLHYQRNAEKQQIIQKIQVLLLPPRYAEDAPPAYSDDEIAPPAYDA